MWTHKIFTFGSLYKSHEYTERTLHPAKIGVWCAISWKHIVGLLFFESTITSEVYQDWIMEFTSLLVMSERDACSLSAGQCPLTMASLQSFFGDRLIFADLCPSCNPDLNPQIFMFEACWKIKFIRLYPPHWRT